MARRVGNPAINTPGNVADADVTALKTDRLGVVHQRERLKDEERRALERDSKMEEGDLIARVRTKSATVLRDGV